MDSSASHPGSLLKRLAAIVAAVVFVIAFICLTGGLYQVEMGHGRYPFVACEFTFTDETGNPIEGVTLTVERPNGSLRHHYPRDDFYSGRTPISDANGVLQFHCCGHSYGSTRVTS